MSQYKENNKPFGQTKRLIRIALEDGWTQTAIAKKARVSQSVVSGWSTGNSKAKYQQIEFLLEAYGSRLRKLSTTVYSTQKYYYELTPELTAFLESKDIDSMPFQTENKMLEMDKLLSNVGSEIKNDLKSKFKPVYKEEITEVEAPIIFRFVFQREFIVDKQKKKHTVEKWILHSLGGGRFLLAIQARRKLSEQEFKNEDKRREQLYDAGYIVPRMNCESWYIQTCNDDAARWNTRFFQFSELEEVFECVAALLSDRQNYPLYSQYDLVTLPFLLKKALLDAGFPIEGVKKITSY